jgi:hypothetical protein
MLLSNNACQTIRCQGKGRDTVLQCAAADKPRVSRFVEVIPDVPFLHALMVRVPAWRIRRRHSVQRSGSQQLVLNISCHEPPSKPPVVLIRLSQTSMMS